jgi:hypothetical protein
VGALNSRTVTFALNVYFPTVMEGGGGDRTVRDCSSVVPAAPSRPRSSGFMRNENWKDSVENICEAAAEEVTPLTRLGSVTTVLRTRYSNFHRT